jgi:hypothetical protein
MGAEEKVREWEKVRGRRGSEMGGSEEEKWKGKRLLEFSSGEICVCANAVDVLFARFCKI